MVNSINQLTNEEFFEIIEQMKQAKYSEMGITFDEINSKDIPLSETHSKEHYKEELKRKPDNVKLRDGNRQLTKDESNIIYNYITIYFFIDKIHTLSIKQKLSLKSIITTILEKETILKKGLTTYYDIFELENLFTIFMINTIELKKAISDVCKKLDVQKNEFIGDDTYESNVYLLYCTFRDYLAHGNSLLSQTKDSNELVVDLDKIRFNLAYIPYYHQKKPLNKMSEHVEIEQYIELSPNFITFLEGLYSDLFSVNEELKEKIQELEDNITETINTLVDEDKESLTLTYNNDNITSYFKNGQTICIKKNNTYHLEMLDYSYNQILDSIDFLRELNVQFNK